MLVFEEKQIKLVSNGDFGYREWKHRVSSDAAANPIRNMIKIKNM